MPRPAWNAILNTRGHRPLWYFFPAGTLKVYRRSPTPPSFTFERAGSSDHAPSFLRSAAGRGEFSGNFWALPLQVNLLIPVWSAARLEVIEIWGETTGFGSKPGCDPFQRCSVESVEHSSLSNETKGCVPAVEERLATWPPPPPSPWTGMPKEWTR